MRLPAISPELTIAAVALGRDGQGRDGLQGHVRLGVELVRLRPRASPAPPDVHLTRIARLSRSNTSTVNVGEALAIGDRCANCTAHAAATAAYLELKTATNDWDLEAAYVQSTGAQWSITGHGYGVSFPPHLSVARLPRRLSRAPNMSKD